MKLLKIALAALMLFTAAESPAQGLLFHNNEYPINERTSFEVFQNKAPQFSGRLDISFQMHLYPIMEIGYILRIKDRDGTAIFNIFYDSRGDDIMMLNEESRRSLIKAHLNLKGLRDAVWFPVKLSFDTEKDRITLDINDETHTVAFDFDSDTFRPEIVFGRSGHIIDVPKFAIRNLRVGGGDKYFFPLFESSGEYVHNSKGKRIGKVTSPDWLIRDSHRWKYLAAFTSQSVAGACYNPGTKEILFYNRDTLHTYNVINGYSGVKKFIGRCPVNLTLGMNYLDTASGRLFTYELYPDGDDTCTTVASLDLNSLEWRAESHDRMRAQLHHHCGFFNPDSLTYTIFGGFGNMSYSPDFHLYDMRSHSWRSLGALQGDPLYPRYFSSAAFDLKKNEAYIFGGMGNMSGEQAVGRCYYYDLHKVDFKNGNVTKLWELPWSDKSVVPARSMIMGNDSSLYALCYPESISTSHLALYKLSIPDGTAEEVSDTIPILSDKIATNANLYYDSKIGEMYATVQEFADDIRSVMRVYSLAFPPLSSEQIAAYDIRTIPVWLILTLSLALICIIIILIIVRRRRKRKYGEDTSETDDELKHASVEAIPDSVCLFGDFSARDKNGKDITYMFTERLKQAFCLILQDSPQGGITSKRLSDTLWPDKEQGKAKNSRGVVINHLRGVLGEMDGVSLEYGNGTFKITQNPPFYCDLTHCMELVSTKEFGDEVLKIVLRGKFLKFSDDAVFDSLKEQVDDTLMPFLSDYMTETFDKENYPKCLEISDAVFNIDSLDETAVSYAVRSLRKMNLEDRAIMRYRDYATAYKKAMGIEPPLSLKSLV